MNGFDRSRLAGIISAGNSSTGVGTHASTCARDETVICRDLYQRPDKVILSPKIFGRPISVTWLPAQHAPVMHLLKVIDDTALHSRHNLLRRLLRALFAATKTDFADERLFKRPGGLTDVTMSTYGFITCSNRACVLNGWLKMNARHPLSSHNWRRLVKTALT